VIAPPGSPNRATKLWKNRFAALAFRRVCTSNIENFSACINSAPQSEFPASNGDDHFVHIPLVVWPSMLLMNAIFERLTKPIDPKPDRFAADNHAPLCQQALNVSRAQCKTMINSGGVSNNRTRIAYAL
jgi:hypothetical protein